MTFLKHFWRVLVVVLNIRSIFGEISVYDDNNNVTTKVNKTLEIKTFSYTFLVNKKTPSLPAVPQLPHLPHLPHLPPLPPLPRSNCMSHMSPGNPLKRLLKRRRSTTPKTTTTTEEYEMYEYYDPDSTSEKEKETPPERSTVTLRIPSTVLPIQKIRTPQKIVPTQEILPTQRILTTQRILPTQNILTIQQILPTQRILPTQNILTAPRVIHLGTKMKYELPNKYEREENDNTLTKFGKTPKFISKYNPVTTKTGYDHSKLGYNHPKLGYNQNFNLPQKFKPHQLTTTTEESYPYDDDYTLAEIEANCGEGLVFFEGGCFPDVS